MPIKRYSTLFSLMTLLLLCSCQTNQKKWTADNLIISDQSTLQFPDTISERQISEDIDFLVYALSTGYGGRNYVPQKSYSDALAALKQIPHNVSVPELHNHIDESLYLIPDNHLKAFYKGKVSKKRQENNPTGRVGANNISDLKKTWETRIDTHKGKKILYISILWFPNHESETWKGLIDSVQKMMKRADAIVLDLRGNTGGDDTKGMELAQLLYGRPFEHPISKQYRNQSPETFALAMTRIKVQMMNLKMDHLPTPSHLTKRLEVLKDEYNKASNDVLPREYVRTGKGGGHRSEAITGFKKPIYLLLDRACGSSCEFLIAAFEWNKYAVKVGENTNGTFHFSNTGIAVLPNSKIKVEIPSQYSEYFDKRFIERIGITPDIIVPADEDAYDFTKRLIKGQ